MAQERAISLKDVFWFPDMAVEDDDNKFDIALPSNMDIRLSDSDIVIGSLFLLSLPLIVLAGKTFFGIEKSPSPFYYEEKPEYYTNEQILNGAYNAYEKTQDLNHQSKHQGYFSNTFNNIKKARDKFLWNLELVSKKVSHFIKHGNFLLYDNTDKENEHDNFSWETIDTLTYDGKIQNSNYDSSFGDYKRHSLDDEEYLDYKDFEAHDDIRSSAISYDTYNDFYPKKLKDLTTITKARPSKRYRMEI